MKITALRVLLVAAVAFAGTAQAQNTVTKLRVQGTLLSASGEAVADGPHLATFTFWDAEVDGNMLWVEKSVKVVTKNGVFAAFIGETAPLSAAFFGAHPALWLGVTVGVDDELPRQPLTPTPLASWSAQCGQATTATAASGLSCTGCVDNTALGFTFVGKGATTVSWDADNAQYVIETIASNPVGKCPDGEVLVGLSAAGDLVCKAMTIPVGACPAGQYLAGFGAGGSLQCKPLFYCGDGMVQNPNEECDDGSANANAPNVCRSDCKAPKCGDSIKDNELGEQCDDGALNADQPDTCRLNCKTPKCNDNIVDSDEQCDDGDNNANAADKCRLNCKNPFCGDLIQDSNEECDDGPGNGNKPDACRIDCKAPKCGDAVKDPGLGEECDNGVAFNADAPDKCRLNCKNPKCGDNITDSAEECDDGSDNANAKDKCRVNCKNPKCGDNIVDTGESCDDGGNTSGDGCSATCTSESKCGAFDGGEKKKITVAELNQCLAALGANCTNVQYIEVAYGKTDYLDKICKEFGYNAYSGNFGGDTCSGGSPRQYPSHCGQGWLGSCCNNGCGNTNYSAFFCN